eukprot:Protomagalhaensia_sp_Gyna_25__5303@NODE_662_length_2894_cov_93_294221_g517_i0_p3_GENE_NODE_662_length_2894_cov_93_294221_g517_i0NODE_662_length_2894_cov_93_294221_g517_i0_p3_ORF_typecomplete_len164_score1_69Ubox/PF04564_15/6_4e03Ubox/PF04564_15/4_3e16zfNse/PF11789_8/6_1e05_NODE_662_length_2894_cov_93_294221_g517_i050541
MWCSPSTRQASSQTGATPQTLKWEFARQYGQPTPANWGNETGFANFLKSKFPGIKFECPITGSVFINPVIAGDGFTYEVEAIINWMKRKGGVSPVTGKRLESLQLFPNNLMKEVIKAQQSRYQARIGLIRIACLLVCLVVILAILRVRPPGWAKSIIMYRDSS